MPLTKKDTVGTWIRDFKKSDAPQFKGKTDKEKRDMAVAAYLSKKREQKEGVLDEKGPKIGVDSLKVIRAQDKAMKPAKPKRMTSTQKSLAAIRAKESTEHPNCGTDDCCQQCDTAVVEEKHPALKRAGVQGFSKPKRTPGHPTKSHVVVVKDGSKVKTIRFGEQGAETAGDPKKGESDRMKNKRKSFKARHGKNIAKGKTSAAYWADKVKW